MVSSGSRSDARVKKAAFRDRMKWREAHRCRSSSFFIPVVSIVTGMCAWYHALVWIPAGNMIVTFMRGA